MLTVKIGVFFNYHFLLTHEILQKMKVKAKILHLKFAPFSFLKRISFLLLLHINYHHHYHQIIMFWDIHIFCKPNERSSKMHYVMIDCSLTFALDEYNYKAVLVNWSFLAYYNIEWITKGLHIPIKLCNTFCSLKQKEGKNLNIWKYFIFVA